MDENPYKSPKIPREPEENKRRRVFAAIFAPLALPAAVIAFFAMCGAHGAMNFSQGVAFVVVTCIFVVAGTVFLGTTWYLLYRWFRN